MNPLQHVGLCISVMLLCGCAGGSGSAWTGPEPTDTPDTGYRGPAEKPAWLRYQLGARGYLWNPCGDLQGTIGDLTVDVCPNTGDSGAPCASLKVGTLITMRKIGLADERVLVEGARAKGAVDLAQVLPIVPKGTQIDCSSDDGATEPHTPVGDIGEPGPASFRVTRTEAAATVEQVAVMTTAGEHVGRPGMLSFTQIDCKVAGYRITFDDQDLE